MNHVIVTAYYPIRTGKHTRSEYDQWISNFFKCVSCPIIVFCDETFNKEIFSNVRYVVRDFLSFKLMQEPWKSRWEKWHEIDDKKNIHSPELYAIWGAKQEFVQEAMKISNFDNYIWCDIGCFRNIRNGSFKNVENYIKPSKITCLNVSNLPGVPNKTIGGGVLAGDKDAWNNFTKLYLEELERDIDGKDQIIYQRILNDSNAVIIEPSYCYGDPWFYLTYIFSI
jgi:hypothetical protein